MPTATRHAKPNGSVRPASYRPPSFTARPSLKQRRIPPAVTIIDYCAATAIVVLLLALILWPML